MGIRVEGDIWRDAEERRRDGKRREALQQAVPFKRPFVRDESCRAGYEADCVAVHALCELDRVNLSLADISQDQGENLGCH